MGIIEIGLLSPGECLKARLERNKLREVNWALQKIEKEITRLKSR